MASRHGLIDWATHVLQRKLQNEAKMQVFANH